jgi:hypothetical protein
MSTCSTAESSETFSNLTLNAAGTVERDFRRDGQSESVGSESGLLHAKPPFGCFERFLELY